MNRTAFTDALRPVLARQRCVFKTQQAIDAGITQAVMRRWIREGYVRRVCRGIYAVVGAPLDDLAWMQIGLLLGGEQAGWSGKAAGVHWGLLQKLPFLIDVVGPNTSRRCHRVRLRQARELELVRHKGFAVTSMTRTIADLARPLGVGELRRVMLEAQWQGRLDLEALSARAARGVTGSRKLRIALASHLPSGRTLSGTEERFIELVTEAGLPLPVLNARISRMTVDMYWRELKLIVEIDGGAAHAGAARVRTDRRRELELRRRGHTVLRYSDEQVFNRPKEIVADLAAAISALSRNT